MAPCVRSNAALNVRSEAFELGEGKVKAACGKGGWEAGKAHATTSTILASFHGTLPMSLLPLYPDWRMAGPPGNWANEPLQAVDG